MSNTTKTILIIVGVLVVVCVCGSAALLATGLWSVSRLVSWADTNVSDNPQVVSGVADEIADFKLPAGFVSQDAMHFADFSFAIYDSQTGDSVIIFAQFPKGTSLDLEEMLNTLKQGSRTVFNTPWYGMQSATIEKKPVTIRGQDSTLIVQEGRTSEGETFRSGMVSFEGASGGPALLMVAGPADEWNAEMLDALIASVK